MTTVPVPRPASDLGLLFRWTGVFAANLVIPGIAAQGLSKPLDLLGIGLGFTALWTLGAAICLRNNRLRPMLLVGGTAVAISQVIPILQLLASGIGVALGRVRLEPRGPGIKQILPILAEGQPIALAIGTLITGVHLIAGALVIGGILLTVFPGPQIRKRRRAFLPDGVGFETLEAEDVA